MSLQTYASAHEFLSETQEILEQNEAANNLMLGICLRLDRNPKTVQTRPYLAAFWNNRELAIAAVMTPPSPLVLYAGVRTQKAAIEAVARNLLEGRWKVSGVLGPHAAAKTFVRAWAKGAGVSCGEKEDMGVYQLNSVVHPVRPPGELRRAEESDFPLVCRWLLGFYQDTRVGGDVSKAKERARSGIAAGDYYLWQDGKPVSMAARVRQTPHGAAVGAVYTPPEFRRRGYASACVAGFSQLLLDSGRQFCALFTDLSNPTSNHIYRQIGYKQVCAVSNYVFEKPT